MKKTLDMLNRMEADGVIGEYAIGGAVGATFYLEPSAMLYVDVFVLLPMPCGGSLLTLAPLYAYLTERGCMIEREHIVIEGWPVQFLPPSDALDEETVRQAVETDVEGIRTWVMTAEHLVAIALRTGRIKDFNRILQFVESGVLETDTLDEILIRYNLLEKWEMFGNTFLRG